MVIQKLKSYVRRKRRARVWEERHTPLTHTAKEMVDAMVGFDGKLMFDNLSEKRDYASWDPERWDPDDYHTDCLKCGAKLHMRGDRSGVSAACPECNVLVFSM